MCLTGQKSWCLLQLPKEQIRFNIHQWSYARLYQLYKVVVSSAAETELAAIFIIGKQCVPLRQALVELFHPQPSTHLITDNETVENLENDTLNRITVNA